MIELILFVIAMASIFALLISLMYMNWLINTLYELGLRWVSSYYLTIRLGFALLSILVIALLSLVILHRRISKVKRARAPGVEIVAYSETLMKRVQDLRLELWKYKRKPSVVAGNVLLFFGVIAFASSVIYESSVLAFIGLGLTFWGVLFSFIRPTRYVRSSLLDSTSFSSLATVDRVLADLRYEGRGVYLPPRYLKGLRGGTVFIPSKKDLIIPTVEEVAQGKVFLKNPEGICLTAPGLGLVNLFERELGKSFAKVGLGYLQNNLPKLFIEGLEIAEDFKMKTQSNTIHVRITGSIYNDLCKEARKLLNVHNSIGCPLCSSIACALARATGKPVIIENNKVSEDGKVIEAYYRTLGANQSTDFPLEEQTKAAPAKVSGEEVSPAPVKPTERNLSYLLRKFVSLFIVALGSYTLVYVGWLTWHDITTWSKSLVSVLFGSRIGEVIILGIGMKIIHYLLIGLPLLLSGISTFFWKRHSVV